MGTYPEWHGKQKNLVGEALPLHCTNHSNAIYVAKTSDDFKQFSPNGGCLKDCDYRLPCGCSFTLKCHIQDPEHKQYQCKKQCTKSVEKATHIKGYVINGAYILQLR